MAEPLPGWKRIPLGDVDRVPMGEGACFVVDGREIAVIRQRDGLWFAVENRCPHRQGPLSEGVTGSGKVICPLHAHVFDLETGEGPGGERVRTYRVQEEEGRILLEMPRAESIR